MPPQLAIGDVGSAGSRSGSGEAQDPIRIEFTPEEGALLQQGLSEGRIPTELQFKIQGNLSLASAMCGLPLFSWVADEVGVPDLPGLRLLFIIKGSNLIFSIPAKAIIRYFQGLSPYVVEGGGKAFSPIAKEILSGIKDEFTLEGSARLEKVASALRWPFKVMFDMGKGSLCSNAFDSMLGKKIEESFKHGETWRHMLSLVAFFIPDILEVNFRSISQFLESTAGKIVLEPLAIISGAILVINFEKELVDYGIGFAVGGLERLKYEKGVARRAVLEHGSPLSWFQGATFDRHLCSGTGLGKFVDWIEGFEVYTGFKDESYTCSYLRKRIRAKDTERLIHYLPILKKQFTNLLVGRKEYSQSKWRELANSGWFDSVDIKDVSRTDMLPQNTADIMKMLAGLGLNPNGVFDLDHLSDGVIIKKDKKDEFLAMLGGEKYVLDERKKNFATALIRAYLNGPSKDLKVMLKIGRELGLVDGNLGFVRNKISVEALLDIVILESVLGVEDDSGRMKKLVGSLLTPVDDIFRESVAAVLPKWVKYVNETFAKFMAAKKVLGDYDVNRCVISQKRFDAQKADECIYNSYDPNDPALADVAKLIATVNGYAEQAGVKVSYLYDAVSAYNNLMGVGLKKEDLIKNGRTEASRIIYKLKYMIATSPEALRDMKRLAAIYMVEKDATYFDNVESDGFWDGINLKVSGASDSSIVFADFSSL